MNSERSNIGFRLLTGMGIGAALMYFLDPERGNRRRHLAGDKARRALRLGRRELHDALENTKNHAVGKVAEVKNRISEDVVDDERLVERVRAELGHRVEHARAIEVAVENGTVSLCGQVPDGEIARAESAAASVRGVRQVENQLMPSQAENPQAAG